MGSSSDDLRSVFADHALSVAPRLLGARFALAGPEGEVAVRITEVEAYHGVGTPGAFDPGSHSKHRRTPRNASMFGPPGHAYVYFSYGMHFAINMVCSPDGVASGVLIRSGEVIRGIDLARRRRAVRRSTVPRDAHLARGPGNLAAALGVTRPLHDGLDLFAAPFAVELEPLSDDSTIRSGPRVGVAGDAGGPAFPWRFWVDGDPTVSAFRPGRGAPVPPR